MRRHALANPVRDLPKPDEAVVVDLRAAADFARGHPRGALSVPFSAKGLAQRLAVVVEPGRAISLHTSEPADASAALAQLQQAYRVIAVLDGSARRQRDLIEESFPDLTVQALVEAFPSGDLTILDVREPVEWETGYAPGAVLISLGSLRSRLEEISRDAVVAVICEAGVRSSTAASLLQAAGFPRVTTVSEGMSAYRRAGFPVEFPAGQERT